MVMVLAFHTEDPDGVVDALNILFFSDLSLLSGLEAALLTQKWDAILGRKTLTFFLYTSLMMRKQKVDPIAGRRSSFMQICLIRCRQGTWPFSLWERSTPSITCGSPQSRSYPRWEGGHASYLTSHGAVSMAYQNS